ncbi:MAG: helix-turn-helix transcriptional regulator [Gemmatimonadota bacterium]
MADHLGEFEQIVLLALVRLGSDGYGISVRDAIAERTGREADFGTVYTTLTRLEQKGYVSSRLGEATPERGGRRKKYFIITASGRAALVAALRALRAMTRGLGQQLELR